MVNNMCAFGHMGLFGTEYLQSLMGFGNVHNWEKDKEKPEDMSVCLPSPQEGTKKVQVAIGPLVSHSRIIERLFFFLC